MRKEIYMGHGLYKYVDEEKSESEKMQEELEPIWHDTQHDESDELEAIKDGEMTEFEKSEYKRKIQKGKEDTIATDSRRRTVWGGLDEFLHTEAECIECADREGDAILTREKVWSEEDLDLKSDEEVEWRIVELEGGGYIRRPFSVKKATLAGPDEPDRPWHFKKGERWVKKY